MHVQSSILITPAGLCRSTYINSSSVSTLEYTATSAADYTRSGYRVLKNLMVQINLKAYTLKLTIKNNNLFIKHIGMFSKGLLFSKEALPPKTQVTKNEQFVHLFVHHSFWLFFFQRKWYFNEKIDCERIPPMQRKGNDLNDLTTSEQQLQRTFWTFFPNKIPRKPTKKIKYFPAPFQR